MLTLNVSFFLRLSFSTVELLFTLATEDGTGSLLLTCRAQGQAGKQVF